MKYLVIWFCLQSAYQTVGGVETYNFKPEIKETQVKTDRFEYEYRNYVIVDTFMEAEVVAGEKISEQVRVHIYELGKEYEVKRIPYDIIESQKVTKHKIVIKEKNK